MEQFQGAVIEKVIRKSGVSITEVARRVGVNRRSMYYWFDQPSLNISTIIKVGRALNYDFSTDFPNLIGSYSIAPAASEGSKERHSDESLTLWKTKYISLLEKYNDLLCSVRAERTNALEKIA